MVLSQEEFNALYKLSKELNVSPSLIDVTKPYIDNLIKLRDASKGVDFVKFKVR